MVGLARALRAGGVEASTGRVMEAVRALEALDPGSVADVYWAGRLALCAGPDDIERYDRAFEAVFSERDPSAPPRLTSTSRQLEVLRVGGTGSDETAADDEPAVRLQASASRVERLRERDFADLTDSERREVDRLLTELRLPGETRRTRRHRPAAGGRIDRGRTVRALLRRGGEPARLRYRRRRRRRRAVVLLVDVSGSMEPYATALLRFAHAACRRRGPRTEVFTIGTRLTRVTREMSHADPDAAMRAVGAAVPDWSGGTRLGETLKDFLDRWGQRGMARGAVVVILSDGWERGGVEVLAEQMARLSRLAHRVVWANPRKTRRDYRPLAGGMAAALPYVDEFVAGSSLASLERLARVVAGVAERSPEHRATERIP